jgi:elongation factor Ts
MSVSANNIKELREKTGAGISDVKNALEESGGDMDKAFKIIERKLGSAAVKRVGRSTGAGLIEAYIHSNGRVGTMVEMLCETDFVARNPAFKELAHDLAMHIAAMSPTYPSLDAVPPEVWNDEKIRFEEESKKLGKPANIVEQIVNGKLKTYFGSMTLLEQSFVKDQNKTVGEVVNEAIGRFGENIKVGNFIRFEI